MPRRAAIVSVLIVVCLVQLAFAQQFPLWERLLRHYGGTSDATPVPSMKMGLHMQMSLKGQPQSGDQQRGQRIIAAAQRVLEHYANVDTALHDGYKPFHPGGKMGEEVHYSNYSYGQLERQQVNYDRPGSILYKRTPDGMQAVGVVYTAPGNATPEQLNAVAPLSLATWHRHVDFCGGPRRAPIEQQFGPNAPFGPQGTIHTEAACKQAHGLWIPVVFGWMTHVYPTAAAPNEIWGGMDMQMGANSADMKM